MKNIIMKLSNVYCGICINKVFRRLDSIPGIENVIITTQGLVNIFTNRNIELNEFKKALNKSNFQILNFIN